MQLLILFFKSCIYNLNSSENLLKDHPADGEKALAALPTKKMVKDTLPGGQPSEESPWEKRQREIRDKFHGKL